MYLGHLPKKQIQTMLIVFFSAEWLGHRREAWSADQRRERHQSWRFNRRNVPNKDHEEFRTVLDDNQRIYDIDGPAAASVSMRGPENRLSPQSLPAQHILVRDRPTVIYTRELQDLQRQADLERRDIYLEDIEGIEYPAEGRALDNRTVRGRIPHREIRINAEEDHDTDSMRRHEMERGSDLGRGSDYRRNDPNRDKEGREYRFLLHRGGNQQALYAHADAEAAVDLNTVVPSRREQFYIRDGDAEILRLVTRGRSLDEQEFAQVGPQPAQRPMTLVPPRQHHAVRADDGKEIIMQRFMDDQRNNSSSQQAEDSDDRGLLTSLHQQDVLVRRLLEDEARLNNTLLLTEALVAQRQHEQFLATAGENIETQSLPGQTTMATQTDVDSSTQTEPLHLMRPPRRRARSDNDDSYTEEEEEEPDDEVNKKDAVKLNSSGNAIYGFWIKKHRSKRRRNSFHRGDLRAKRPGGKGGFFVSGKRHKIKTPILEETESALEAAEGQHDYIAFSSYAQNKSSMLRRRKNKVKVATTSGEMEVTILPNQLQNGQEDIEETPTDSLEEGSPSNQKYTPRHKNMDSHITQTPKTVSTSVGDVRHVNFEGGVRLSSKVQPIEFEDSEIRGNSSHKWIISDPKLQSLPEKGRDKALTYVASSESNGRPSEQESSTETKNNERHTVPESIYETDMNKMRSNRSDTGLDVLTSSRIFRRNSVPNNEEFHKKNRSSRRGSLSEPGKTELQDLSQRQTVSSRAKSVSHVNKVGKKNEDVSMSVPVARKGSRYMEWYKTKREERERRKEEEKAEKKEKQKKKQKPNQSIMTDKKVSKISGKEKRGPLTENRGQRKIGEVDVDKELERAEEQILKVTVLDDDMDSGIAMSSMVMGGGGRKKRNQQLLEKKSVFTIAYDDMQTKQLRPDSSSPHY